MTPMHSHKPSARTAEDERRDILDYILHLHRAWSVVSPSVRPGLDSAITSIADDIGKGRHVTVPAHKHDAANPDFYRSIALANGAKECNVYHHDDKVVVVVEMAPNRSLKEVDSALQHSLPLAAFERIKLRELRPLHDGVTAQTGQATTREEWHRRWQEADVDSLINLERRIVELEHSVRNNTRRLDLAAAACQLPEQWVKDISSRTKIQLLAERLGAGLKEKP